MSEIETPLSQRFGTAVAMSKYREGHPRRIGVVTMTDTVPDKRKPKPFMVPVRWRDNKRITHVNEKHLVVLDPDPGTNTLDG